MVIFFFFTYIYYILGFRGVNLELLKYQMSYQHIVIHLNIISGIHIIRQCKILMGKHLFYNKMDKMHLSNLHLFFSICIIIIDN